MEQEACMQFKTVDQEFKVIDSDSVTAIIDDSFAEAIAGGKGDWRMLQKNLYPSIVIRQRHGI